MCDCNLLEARRYTTTYKLMVLCCAAPIALVLFGTAGLAALAGYLDYLLFAALAIGLPLYARYHKRKQDAGFTNEDSEKRDD